VRIVQCDVGQVGGQKGIDATAGSHEEHLRVDDTGAQGSGEHARHVDHPDPGRAVHHLQGNAEEQLDDDVEAQVEPVGVQEHVAEEAPHLEPPIWAIDQHRIRRNRNREPEVLGGHCVAVVGEDGNLKWREEGRLGVSFGVSHTDLCCCCLARDRVPNKVL